MYQGIIHLFLLTCIYTPKYSTHTSLPKNYMYVHAYAHTQGKVVVFCFFTFFYNAVVALKYCKNLNLASCQVPNALKQDTAEWTQDKEI